MAILEDRFGVPPFTVLNTNQGYWGSRKKQWNSIGIESEVGRDATSYNIKDWLDEKREDGELTGHVNLVDTSIFDPVLTELSYKWFCKPNGTILDPFCGGSVRGIVAGALGYEYTGIELREEQVTANYDNVPKLSIDLAVDPVWLEGDSMNIKNIGGEYDMVFSCPPYYDLEEYSNDPRDLSHMSYPRFVEQYTKIIKNACSMLKPDSFAVFVVGEIRDKEGFYRNFVGDTIKAFTSSGMKYYNEAILFTSINTASLRVTKQFEPYRKFAKVHQNILVFYKGNTDRITQMDMENNKFTPLKELKQEKRIRKRVLVGRKLEENQMDTVMPDTDIICDVCKFKSKDKEQYEWHLTRRYHQEVVEQNGM